MTQHSSGQLAPCISQTVSCAMPVLPSLSSSSVFCTVFFFPFSCKSFCLVEKMFQHSHMLHPFLSIPAAAVDDSHSHSYNSCLLMESKAESGIVKAFAKFTLLLHLPLKHTVAHVFKWFSKILNSPALKCFLIYRRKFIAAAEKQWDCSAKLTHVLPYRSHMRMWIAWKD